MFTETITKNTLVFPKGAEEFSTQSVKHKYQTCYIYFLPSESLQMVTASMKLKDTCSLGEKVWPTSVQFSSVAQSCPTLCDPMNRSTPGLPVHHQFPEFTQTHVHRVSDAIQPSHPRSSPSPPASNPSQHQSLFQHHSSKASILQCSAFFIVQLTSIHDYWKNHSFD